MSARRAGSSVRAFLGPTWTSQSQGSTNPFALPLQAVDFDPHSLRNILPRAAAIVHERLQRGDRLYVHCTAGLGRAPAVCIAYLYWFQGMTLDAVCPCLLCSDSCLLATQWLFYFC